MSQEHKVYAESLETLALSISEASVPLAEGLWDLYQAFQKAGFSEEQAFELVKSDPIQADFK